MDSIKTNLNGISKIIGDTLKNIQVDTSSFRLDPISSTPMVSPKELDSFLKNIHASEQAKIKQEKEEFEATVGTYKALSNLKQIIENYIFATEKQIESANKQNIRLYWLTVASTLATITSTILAIIQLFQFFKG